jgi:hypothetical protein
MWSVSPGLLAWPPEILHAKAEADALFAQINAEPGNAPNGPSRAGWVSNANAKLSFVIE